LRLGHRQFAETPPHFAPELRQFPRQRLMILRQTIHLGVERVDLGFDGLDSLVDPAVEGFEAIVDPAV